MNKDVYINNTLDRITVNFTDLWSYEPQITTDLSNMRHYWKRNKKLSYCWEIVRRESMPRIAEMDVKMTT